MDSFAYLLDLCEYDTLWLELEDNILLKCKSEGYVDISDQGQTKGRITNELSRVFNFGQIAHKK